MDLQLSDGDLSLNSGKTNKEHSAPRSAAVPNPSSGESSGNQVLPTPVPADQALSSAAAPDPSGGENSGDQGQPPPVLAD